MSIIRAKRTTRLKRCFSPASLSLMAVLMLNGCATAPPPSPDLNAGVRRAIADAQNAGAEEHAPLELRFAREKLDAAKQASAAEEYDRANYLLEQAEVDAELALARTRAEQVRMQAEALSDEVRQLRQNIADNFGLEALE